MLKFIVDEPALMIGKTLVIADLHIGLEYELLSRGFNIPDQSDMMLGRIRRIFKENKCKELIVIGDLKHRIMKIAWPEQEEISEFVGKLEKLGPVKVVKGNHDANIENYVRNVVPATGFEHKGYWIFHGHAKPPKEAAKMKQIAAHMHPKIEFKDSLGGRVSESVWVRSGNLVIMPNFNHLLSGTNVAGDEVFKPMRDYIDPKKAELYLLDGLYLGTIAEIQRGRKND
jgi:putative SbcD/Mre11-related phosphoesterase